VFAGDPEAICRAMSKRRLVQDGSTDLQIATMLKMKTISLVLIIAFASSQPHRRLKTGPYALPAEAQITIGQPHSDPNDGQEAVICPSYRLSEHEVREKFRTYHLLKPGELHDSYSFPSCRIEGTVLLEDRKFYWVARPGNTLDTDWPGGKSKMLGGVPSENPAKY